MICALLCRYLGPGYWIMVAPLSREFHREYSKHHPPHSDPALILRSKPLIRWFMERFMRKRKRVWKRNPRWGVSERVRIIYRGLAGACYFSEAEGLTLLETCEWVKETYGFAADTSAYCTAIRQIPYRSKLPRLPKQQQSARVPPFFTMLVADTERNRNLHDAAGMLPFFHTMLVADVERNRNLLDAARIYKALLSVPINKDTYGLVVDEILWLLEKMDIKHPCLNKYEIYHYVRGQQYPESTPSIHTIDFMHRVFFSEPMKCQPITIDPWLEEMIGCSEKKYRLSVTTISEPAHMKWCPYSPGSSVDSIPQGK